MIKFVHEFARTQKVMTIRNYEETLNSHPLFLISSFPKPKSASILRSQHQHSTLYLPSRIPQKSSRKKRIAEKPKFPGEICGARNSSLPDPRNTKSTRVTAYKAAERLGSRAAARRIARDDAVVISGRPGSSSRA